MKVLLDSTKCQGHLRCQGVAPDLFGYDDDGYAVLLPADGEVPADREQAAQLAVGNCPERAIVLVET